ncbi:uncharacterized protein isoform X4 [Danio rerio]|uniref:Uncharacterized protein isoform X4 n=1 Tax=Danio rerio TaxID=7955 RepID=A0AC58J9K9_DANRE
MCLDRTVNRSRAPGRLDYIYWRDGRLLRTGKEHRSEDGVIKTEHRQRQYPRVRGDHDHTLEAEDHHPMRLRDVFGPYSQQKQSSGTFGLHLQA